MSRRLPPGSVVLFEDTTGKGGISRLLKDSSWPSYEALRHWAMEPRSHDWHSLLTGQVCAHAAVMVEREKAARVLAALPSWTWAAKERPLFFRNRLGAPALLWARDTGARLMPRFFFHLRGDGQNFEDAIGSEFESVQHAEMAALRAASYMLEEAKEPALTHRPMSVLTR